MDNRTPTFIPDEIPMEIQRKEPVKDCKLKYVARSCELKGNWN